jgi:hypothetical protein
MSEPENNPGVPTPEPYKPAPTGKRGRPRGRPRKPSVLTDEAVAQLKGLASNKEQALERAQEAARQERIAQVEQVRVDNRILSHAQKSKTRAEFNEILRGSLSEQTVRKYTEASEIVDNMIFWADHAWELTVDDPDFVSLKDGIDLMDDHIQNFGYGSIHDVEYESFFLQNFQPRVSIWNDDYYKDSERLIELCKAESEGTRIFALYRYHVTLSQSFVQVFKNTIADHKVSVPHVKAWHRQYDREGYRPCWLCRYERHHGKPYIEPQRV